TAAPDPGRPGLLPLGRRLPGRGRERDIPPTMHVPYARGGNDVPAPRHNPGPARGAPAPPRSRSGPPRAHPGAAPAPPMAVAPAGPTTGVHLRHPSGADERRNRLGLGLQRRDEDVEALLELVVGDGERRDEPQ